MENAQHNRTHLKGKTALVTGSTGGLGLAIADALARAGCNIVLHGLDAPQDAQTHIDNLQREYGVQARYLKADLLIQTSIPAMFEKIGATFGGVDILVNNAVLRHFEPIESLPVQSLNNALAVNVTAAFHAIQMSLPHMRAREWGRIFNMTSVYSARAVANRLDYITTKTALVGMTRAVAIETIHQGITCNALCPGSVLTPDIEKRVQALMEKESLDIEKATQLFLLGKQPTCRFVEASHIADMLVFLCGPAGRDITGAILPVEGGWLAV